MEMKTKFGHNPFKRAHPGTAPVRSSAFRRFGPFVTFGRVNAELQTNHPTCFGAVSGCARVEISMVFRLSNPRVLSYLSELFSANHAECFYQNLRVPDE
jgi:hypothetical protein